MSAKSIKSSQIPINKNAQLCPLPEERINSKIFFFRNKKVMLDRDLAELYGVQTKVLNQALRRNISRFPEDFVFQLTKKESDFLRSQIVTLGLGKGKHSKYLPYAFTEQGIAMLSSVLSSERAIQVNILIMRTFTKIREMMITNEQLRHKIEELEQKYDRKFAIVFEVIKKILDQNDAPSKTPIGFKLN